MTSSTANSTPPEDDGSTPSSTPTDGSPSTSPPTPNDGLTVARVRPPKRLDRRYTAGLIDGEGCFTILMTTSPLHQRRYFAPIVQISSTDRYILECMQHTWGGAVGSNGRKRVHARVAYKWRLTGKAVGDFIRDVGPYLVIKKPIAKVLYAFIKYRAQKSSTQAGYLAYRRKVIKINRRGTLD